MATLLRRPLADVAACLFPGHGGPPLISAFTSASTRYGAAISRTAIPAKSDLAVETLDSSRGLQDWTILGSVRHPERSTLGIFLVFHLRNCASAVRIDQITAIHS